MLRIVLIFVLENRHRSYLFVSVFVETVKYILSGTVVCVCVRLGADAVFFLLLSCQCPRAIELKTEHFTENAIRVA